jgi:universal stress protein A
MSDHQYKHIVCAIEPNEEATDIVNIAAHLAQRDSCSLTLIHVVPPMWQPYADLNFTPIVEGQIALEEALLESAKNKINDLITKASIDAAEVIVKTGDPVFSIVGCAKEHDGALVIMGVHNRRGLQRLLGSIAHGVLNGTDHPILLVHADEHASSHYDNVLVALDTSPAMPMVLEQAASFIAHAEHYKVITAVRSLAATMGNLQAAAFASSWPVIEMQEELVKTVKSTVTETLTDAGLAADSATVVEGDAAHEICASAQSQGADLIVMGSGRRNILDRILLGSTAHGVLNHTPCDVYIAR